MTLRLLASTALLLLLSASAHAAQPTDFVGDWQVEDPEAARAEIDRVVEEGLLNIPPFFRGMARGRIQRNLQLPEEVNVRLEQEGAVMAVGSNLDEATSTPLDGSPVTIVRNGREVELRRQMAGEAVETFAVGPNGSQTSRMWFEGEVLLMTGVIESEHFQEPLDWTLRFVRAEQQGE